MGTNRTLRLTGWQGGTTGLRVDADSRRLVLLPLKRTMQRVRIELPGHPIQPLCDVSPTFWTTCPEFRSAEIGRWMTKRGDKPWPPKNPPRYEAELVMEDGDTVTIRILEDTLADDVYVPTSDRIVTLDHNSDSFLHATAALEETLACLRGNNEMDADDKARIELELDSGLKMIKAAKIRIHAVRVMLVGALKWLVDRFASAVVGIAAAKALPAIRVVLGL